MNYRPTGNSRDFAWADELAMIEFGDALFTDDLDDAMRVPSGVRVKIPLSWPRCP